MTDIRGGGGVSGGGIEVFGSLGVGSRWYEGGSGDCIVCFSLRMAMAGMRVDSMCACCVGVKGVGFEGRLL